MSVNLTFPLRRSTKGAFATNDSTLDAVEDDLKILLLTNHGERPIHYDFGANLRSIIFEQQGASLRQMAEDLIRTAVGKWMPFCNLVSVNIQDSATNSTLKSNEIHVELEFSIGNIDITRTLKQRIRG